MTELLVVHDDYTVTMHGREFTLASPIWYEADYTRYPERGFGTQKVSFDVYECPPPFKRREFNTVDLKQLREDRNNRKMIEAMNLAFDLAAADNFGWPSG